MPDSPTKKSWGPEEDAALARRATQILLQNRSDIYAAPGLEDFTGHGASRINDKLQQWLKKACGAEIVKEEVDKMKGGRGGAKNGTPTKTKVTPTKKRKVEAVGEEDE